MSLVVVTGTGTEIGKTWIATMAVEAWARASGKRIAGWKPVESGGTEDGCSLEQVSTFHVKRFPPPYLLKRPVSPHLAAEAEGREIEVEVIVEQAEALRAEADGVLVELPGGLFSPLSRKATNHELLERLAPTRSLLVAPDRLGVLHDVTAVLRATRARIDAIILSAPASPDASTGTNAQELAHFTSTPILGVVTRGARALPALEEWMKSIPTR